MKFKICVSERPNTAAVIESKSRIPASSSSSLSKRKTLRAEFDVQVDIETDAGTIHSFSGISSTYGEIFTGLI